MRLKYEPQFLAYLATVRQERRDRLAATEERRNNAKEERRNSAKDAQKSSADARSDRAA